MTGMSILLHSVRQVFGNFNAALRISIPAVIAAVASIPLGSALGIDQVNAANLAAVIEQDPSILMRFIFLNGVVFFGVLWTAVAWHRFVLTEEMPGALPAFHGPQMVKYLGHSLLIGLVVGVGFLVFANVLGTILLGLGLDQVLTLIVTLMVAVLVMLYVLYRISLVLPAAAMGARMSIIGSWRLTAPNARAIFGLALILMALLVVINMLITPLAAQSSSMVISILFVPLQWAFMMVGASILTTLYGVCVEGRDLSV